MNNNKTLLKYSLFTLTALALIAAYIEGIPIGPETKLMMGIRENGLIIVTANHDTEQQYLPGDVAQEFLQWSPLEGSGDTKDGGFYKFKGIELGY